MIGNPELAAGVATTIQLIRLSMYSITQVQLATKKRKDNSSDTARSEIVESEKTPLISGNKESYIVAESDKDNNRDEELGVTEERGSHIVSPKTVFEIFLTKTSVGIQLAFCVYFLISTSFVPVDDKQWLLVASLVFFIGSLMMFCDLKRNRFGYFQRFFHVTSAIVVWASSTIAYPSPTIWKINLLLCLYVIFTLTESVVISFPEDDDISRLSMRTFGALLKPYFWPNQTESAALTNRIRAYFVWGCVALGRLCNLASPLLLGQAATALTRENYVDVIKFSLIYCVLEFLGYSFNAIRSILNKKFDKASYVQLAETAFSHVCSLSLDWHRDKKIDQVVRDLDKGITGWNTLMKYMLGRVIPFVGEVVAVCLIFTAHFSNWQLSVILFYSIFLYIVWTIVLVMQRKNNSKETMEKDGSWCESAIESLPDFETLKYFSGEKLESKRFGDAMKHESDSSATENFLAFRNISQRLIFQVCLAAAFALSAVGVKKNDMDAGDFVAVLVYVSQLFNSLKYLDSVSDSIVMAFVDSSNLLKIMSEKHDVVDAIDAVALDTLPTASWENEYAIEFDNVHFNYPTQCIKQGLKGISFKVKRGTTTAIVGPEGAGKTTIPRLLCRFFDVRRGCVKVNGLDIRGITQESLRDSIGVVPQTANIFNETLRSNVAYGRLHHTAVSQEELDEVANEAQLSTFIDTLDEGWETMVGDHNLKLSDCEKQRMAIARCLLKHPPIVLLDNATSGLETETESSVQESLDRLSQKRSVLVITDKLGTIRNANSIIFLRNGSVHEQGTHDELMELNGQYAKMWNLQLNTDSSTL